MEERRGLSPSFFVKKLIIGYNTEDPKIMLMIKSLFWKSSQIFRNIKNGFKIWV